MTLSKTRTPTIKRPATIQQNPGHEYYMNSYRRTCDLPLFDLQPSHIHILQVRVICKRTLDEFVSAFLARKFPLERSVNIFLLAVFERVLFLTDRRGSYMKYIYVCVRWKALRVRWTTTVGRFLSIRIFLFVYWREEEERRMYMYVRIKVAREWARTDTKNKSSHGLFSCLIGRLRRDFKSRMSLSNLEIMLDSHAQLHLYRFSV